VQQIEGALRRKRLGVDIPAESFQLQGHSLEIQSDGRGLLEDVIAQISVKTSETMLLRGWGMHLLWCGFAQRVYPEVNTLAVIFHRSRALGFPWTRSTIWWFGSQYT